MTKYGWLIYKKTDAIQNQSYIDWFIEEAEKKDIFLKLIYREHLTIGVINNKLYACYKGKTNPRPEFAVVRTIEPLLNRQLENMGITVFNSSAVSWICNNKALAHQQINLMGIPMVDTIFLTTNQLEEKPPFLFPFVIKESAGRGGQQVYMIKNNTQYKQVKQLISTEELVLQTCNVQLGKDLRVFVIGKEIIGAVLRENQTDFRANFKLGGSAKWYTLSEKETKMVSHIVRSFDFGMVGIDFLFSEDGNLLFNEIEDVVGSRTLSKVSSVNILEKYVAHISKNLGK